MDWSSGQSSSAVQSLMSEELGFKLGSNKRNHLPESKSDTAKNMRDLKHNLSPQLALQRK